MGKEEGWGARGGSCVVTAYSSFCSRHCQYLLKLAYTNTIIGIKINSTIISTFIQRQSCRCKHCMPRGWSGLRTKRYPTGIHSTLEKTLVESHTLLLPQ